MCNWFYRVPALVPFLFVSAGKIIWDCVICALYWPTSNVWILTGKIAVITVSIAEFCINLFYILFNLDLSDRVEVICCILTKVSFVLVIVYHVNDEFCGSDWTEADGSSANVSASRQQLFIVLSDWWLSIIILVKFHSGLSLSLLSASQCLWALARVLLCVCLCYFCQLSNVKQSNVQYWLAVHMHSDSNWVRSTVRHQLTRC